MLMGVIACTGVVAPEVSVAFMEVSTIGYSVLKMYYLRSAFSYTFVAQM